MAEYLLSPGAANDLHDIARYTLRTWGAAQLDHYEAGLKRCLEALACGKAHTTSPLAHRPELVGMHCQQHFIFALRERGDTHVILAILHERMDLMQRLAERLVPH